MNENTSSGFTPIRWPFPVDYEKVNRIEVDLVVLGAGPAGCCAGISALRRGQSVAVCDKGAIKKSGNCGAGIDHWNDLTEAPLSSQTADEKHNGPNPENRMNRGMIGITGPDLLHRNYISNKGTWSALLELEKMGLPIRDVDGDFDGNPSRDEATGLLKSYNYNHMDGVKLRGGNFVKPVLYNELKKEGALLFDYMMMTGLLTEGGKQGAPVTGAMGFSLQTGEFYVFVAKAVVISTGYVCSNWIYSMEITGNSFRWDPNDIGEGVAMAHKAGAKTYGFYNNGATKGSHPFAWPRFGVGDDSNTWSYCTIVDNNGKKIPWHDNDGNEMPDAMDRYLGKGKSPMGPTASLLDAVKDGEYELPFWADLSDLPERERRSIWGMMIGNEGKTRYTLYDYYTRNGFNPDKHLLFIPVDGRKAKGGMHGNQGEATVWRSERGGQGFLVVDWDLMSNIPGLFAAGASIGLEGCSLACASGFYAGNRAAEYCMEHSHGTIDEKQIELERERVYAPTKRVGDENAYITWKELWGGTARVMQQCCGELLTKSLLEFGIDWLESIAKSEARKTFARNPHELARVLECETRITVSKLYMGACLSKLAADEEGFENKDFLFNWDENGELKSEIVPRDYYLKEPYLDTYAANYALHTAKEEVSHE